MNRREASTFVLVAVAAAAALLVTTGCTTSRERGVASSAPHPPSGDEIYIGLASVECLFAGCIDYSLYIFEDGSVVCHLREFDKVHKTFRKQSGPETFLALKAHLIQSDFFSRTDEESPLSHGRMATVSADLGEGRMHRQLAFGAGNATKPGEWPTVELMIHATDVGKWTDMKRRQQWARRGR